MVETYCQSREKERQKKERGQFWLSLSHLLQPPIYYIYARFSYQWRQCWFADTKILLHLIQCTKPKIASLGQFVKKMTILCCRQWCLWSLPIMLCINDAQSSVFHFKQNLVQASLQTGFEYRNAFFEV